MHKARGTIMKTWNAVKTLIAVAVLAGPLAAFAQSGGSHVDCPAGATPQLQTHGAHDISIEQAARFGLTLPCPRSAGASPEQQAQRRQLMAELQAELAQRRASSERSGFRPELYGLALPARQARAVRVVATTGSYNALIGRPTRLESGD
jgi:hypothetical protein